FSSMNLLNNKHFKAFVKWYGDRMVQIAQLTPQSMRWPSSLYPFYDIRPADRQERREQSRRRKPK
ncbi:MAG: hypothetical protein WCB17_10790, partial [Dehalococcoidales bacterium]